MAACAARLVLALDGLTRYVVPTPELARALFGGPALSVRIGPCTLRAAPSCGREPRDASVAGRVPPPTWCWRGSPSTERARRADQVVEGALRTALNFNRGVPEDLAFYQLGGDSLVVIRALYAAHRGQPIPLEWRAWDVRRLLGAETVGEGAGKGEEGAATGNDAAGDGKDDDRADADGADRLFHALSAALARQQTPVALCLLRHVPPNLGAGPGHNDAGATRLGKIADRRVRRATFRLTSVHLAAIAGDLAALGALLRAGWAANCSRASDGGTSPPGPARWRKATPRVRTRAWTGTGTRKPRARIPQGQQPLDPPSLCCADAQRPSCILRARALDAGAGRGRFVCDEPGSTVAQIAWDYDSDCQPVVFINIERVTGIFNIRGDKNYSISAFLHKAITCRC